MKYKIFWFFFFTSIVAYTNEKPYFTSDPITFVSEDYVYNYQITVADADSDTVSIFIIKKPDWLNFTNAKIDTAYLTGVPADITDSVLIAATDGIDTVFQEFVIIIGCLNCCFIISSTPPFTAKVGEMYTYFPIITDSDPGEEINITIDTFPKWLTVDTSNSGELMLNGIPTINDTGNSKVDIKFYKPGPCGGTFHQNFIITVEKPDESKLIGFSEKRIEISPNPFTDNLILNFGIGLEQSGTLEIINSTGKILYQGKWISSSENINLDLHELSPDLYFLRLIYADRIQTFKIIKR